MKVAVSAPLAIAMGAWLRDRDDLWWMVVLTGALASVCLAWLYRRIPSEQLDRHRRGADCACSPTSS